MKKIFTLILLAVCLIVVSLFQSGRDNSGQDNSVQPSPGTKQMPASEPVQDAKPSPRIPEKTIRQEVPSSHQSESVPHKTNHKARWDSGNLSRHWEKHKSEFPEFKTELEYGDAALKFFSNPPPGTLQKYHDNGDRLYYNPSDNTFGVTTKDGTPKTLFRPDNGKKYWMKQ